MTKPLLRDVSDDPDVFNKEPDSAISPTTPIDPNKGDFGGPSISIIIPSYNSGAYLPFTLESISSQEYSNIEVIIVDGGSSDDTANVVDSFREIVTFFVSEKDDGQSDAVNKGFQHATGDFIIWQNADDVFMPNAFSSFVDRFNEDKSHDIFFGDIVLMDVNGHEIWQRYFTNIDRLIARYHGLICNNQAAFIKREVIEQFGFLDKSYHYAMDREFFLRLYQNGVKFKHFKNVIAGFRHQPDSKTENPENAVKWFIEETRIAKTYHLFLPGGVMETALEKLSSIDKAIRLLATNPIGFVNTTKRWIRAGTNRVVEQK